MSITVYTKPPVSNATPPTVPWTVKALPMKSWI